MCDAPGSRPAEVPCRDPMRSTRQRPNPARASPGRGALPACRRPSATRDAGAAGGLGDERFADHRRHPAGRRPRRLRAAPRPTPASTAWPRPASGSHNAHAHNVVTLPCHANILSGLLPTRRTASGTTRGFRFPAAADTLATLLKAARLPHGRLRQRLPARRALRPRPRLRRLRRRASSAASRVPACRSRRDRAPRPSSGRGDSSRRCPRASPGSCWVHVYEPHFPYVNANYQDDVAAADSARGAAPRAALARRTGGATLVVATGDHGESLGEHGEATHGILAYEATLRVPLVIAMAGAPPAVVTDAVRHVDIAAHDPRGCRRRNSWRPRWAKPPARDSGPGAGGRTVLLRGPLGKPRPRLGAAARRHRRQPEVRRPADRGAVRPRQRPCRAQEPRGRQGRRCPAAAPAHGPASWRTARARFGRNRRER